MDPKEYGVGKLWTELQVIPKKGESWYASHREEGESPLRREARERCFIDPVMALEAQLPMGCAPLVPSGEPTLNGTGSLPGKALEPLKSLSRAELTLSRERLSR